MKVIGLTIAVLFCLCLIFLSPGRASADSTEAEVADLRAQLKAIQYRIDVLTTQQTIGIANAPVPQMAVAALTGQCAAGSCAVGQSYSSSTSVRASIRTGERRGLFSRFRARRGGGCG